jgi:hypothetical protein
MSEGVNLMLRVLAVALWCGSWAVAQERSPILTDDGQPIKVIVGTTVITPTNPPRLHTPPATSGGVVVEPEVLPYPRILAVDEAAKPRQMGLLNYLFDETMAFVKERRSQVRQASHQTLSDKEPALLTDTVRDTKPVLPVAPQEVHVTHTAVAPEAPTFAAALLQQTVAIIAAVVVLGFVMLAAYLLVLRKYVPFTSLFQVQVVGSGIGTGVPFMPTALAEAEKANDPFADVTPNFELGPTYEEELAFKAAASERQELAVLEHIANLNAAVQHELKQQGYLSDEPPAQSALETLTNPEPAV